MSKEKLVKKVLQLAKPHPKNVMQFNNHKITHLPQEFELTESEIKSLEKDKGPKYWLKVVEVKESKK